MGKGRVARWVVAGVAAAVLFIAPSWVSDLGPMPDALEYAVTAQRLARFESFGLPLLDQVYPSRYPFGFPAFLVPAYWLPGATLGTGIYGVVLAGVLAVALTYRLAGRIGGTLAGVAAAATLLLRPGFVEWNRHIMTESLSAALAVMAGLLLHRAAGAEGRAPRWRLLALGAVCGLAILVRYTNFVFTVGSILGYLACRPVPREPDSVGSRVSGLLLLLSGPVLAVVALAIYQQATFGGALTTGYDYWLSAWHGSPGSTFSVRYAFLAPGDPADGPLAGWPNAAYYAAYLVTRVSSPLLLVAGIAGGLVLIRRRDDPNFAVGCYIGSCVLLLYLIYSLYWFQSKRFMAPVLPLAAVLTGVGVGGGVQAARRGKLLGWGLVALWCAGVIATLPGIVGRSYLVQRYVRGHREPPEFPLRARSVEAYTDMQSPGAIIVTALPLPLLDRGLLGDRRIVPLARRRYWMHPDLARVATLAEQRQVVDSALAAGASVYTDAYSLAVVRSNPGYGAERRAVEAYELAPVERSKRNGRVLLFRLGSRGD